MLLRQQPNQSSFKRGTPVMGNRSLETRNSKRSQQHPMQRKESPSGSGSGSINSNSGPMSVPNVVMGSPALPANVVTTPLTVGALEVQNVKRAIHRYGTLPKGARIGAYLESLRQGTEGAVVTSPTTTTNGHSKASDANVVPPPNLSVAPAPQGPAPPATSPKNTSSPRPVPKSVAQPHMIRSNSSSGVTMANSASASVTKLQRHRTTTEGNMMSFSSFRGGSVATGSPKRTYHPTLADLEFPPPPADLPPPPEEFENGKEQQQQQSHSLRSGSTSQMETSQASLTVNLSNDVSNTAPSVEEASSRFGVSLRRRERSTDSCSSLGSPGEPLEAGNPVGTKEKEQPKSIKLDPAAILVNELAESMNLKVVAAAGGKSSAGSTPNHLPPKTPVVSDYAVGGSFKSQLKRVEPKRVASTPVREETSAIIDFKSRLRKVENNNDDSGIDEDATRMKSGDTASNESLNNDTQGPGGNNGKTRTAAAATAPTDCHHHDNNNVRKTTTATTTTGLKRTSVGYGEKQQQNNHCNGASISNSNGKVAVKELKKTEIKIDIQGHEAVAAVTSGETVTDGEDKRKSTGSISSLKKLWEAKEVSPLLEQPQLSPKLAMKNGNSNSEEGDDSNSNVAKKPAVPLKPTNLTIYATPIQTSMTASTTGPSGSGSSTTTAQSITSGSVRATNRESILELVALLECSLKLPVSSISASQWLQLSDKLNILQTSCVSFADRESMPPHSKFQFRELVERVETQSRSLRSAGNKNSQDNEKLVVEVGQSLKQITNALLR